MLFLVQYIVMTSLYAVITLEIQNCQNTTNHEF